MGVLTNPLPFPLHNLDSASLTQETLKFRERNLSAYAAKLLGDWFSLNARYRVSEATLMGHFPEVTAAGIESLDENKRAVLHQVSLGANFNHPSVELTLGVLNLFDTDYRLNPLNVHSELPRGRTLVASLRLNF